ncbi:MAG: hypothetical protein KAH38_03230, partial [Candidatus Hydrogenedentes bacterium]|nr:hypothetical protein [Candidatus Hydrogenedentota bacterium]
ILTAYFGRPLARAATRPAQGILPALASGTVRYARTTSCTVICLPAYESGVGAVSAVVPEKTAVEIPYTGKNIAAGTTAGAKGRAFILADDRAISPPVLFFASLSEVGAICDANPGQAAFFIISAG